MECIVALLSGMKVRRAVVGDRSVHEIIPQKHRKRVGGLLALC